MLRTHCLLDRKGDFLDYKRANAAMLRRRSRARENPDEIVLEMSLSLHTVIIFICYAQPSTLARLQNSAPRVQKN
jgi:hypothetical protein